MARGSRGCWEVIWRLMRGGLEDVERWCRGCGEVVQRM